MRELIQNEIQAFISGYIEDRGLENIWREPRARFTEAAKIVELRKLVVPDHHVPADFLPEANVVVSYFLPFKKNIGQSNIGNRMASETWAKAYIDTNEMVTHLNDHLVEMLVQQGYEAAVPYDTGIISADVLKSRWSQRHIAFMAGHGTFGINNMLITDQGCCGRFFSIVACLPVEPDRALLEERCLFKRDGSCGICVERCVAGALKEDSFDRFACSALCKENEALYPRANVCGKCVAGVPCSYTG